MTPPDPHRDAPPPASTADAERDRIAQDAAGTASWSLWGPYLAERQWGTVREDYSADGSAWTSFPHDHARSRAYRWGEDGLLGICDAHMRLCFAIALWNGRDPILKERLFGLTGPEGNHGEDAKEVWFHQDATPTASWLRATYRYPIDAFPYERLVVDNGVRTRVDPELELTDTGIFAGDRFVDAEVAYAKLGPADIAIRVRLTNHASESVTIHVLPTLWFRNTWAWDVGARVPSIDPVGDPPPDAAGPLLRADHPTLGTTWLASAEPAPVMRTGNETNAERLWNTASRSRAVKDAFHDAVVGGDASRLAAPDEPATKAALHHVWELEPGETRTTFLRLAAGAAPAPADRGVLEAALAAREAEADAFHASITPAGLDEDERLVQRRAFAGLVWTKQVYLYDVGRWLDGDPVGPPPPPERATGRNADWRELNNADVLSVPDAWEYPWYAAWDLAFHCVPFALIDPAFAKAQLLLLTREWYMHPNGQLPAYEWNFSDVNPPVHAWATWRVYKMEAARWGGTPDRGFLERVFHKLLLTFTWWVNRKDRDGRNVFQGGFLGLDNIGVFDRSAPLPAGGHLGQADGTAWMGFFALQMMRIALELADENPVYEDLATKFFEHFLYIAEAMHDMGNEGVRLWDEEDGFFYDVLHLPDGAMIPLRVRSMVGLIPLLAVETLEPEVLDRHPAFARRLRWFLRNRPALASLVASWEDPGVGERRLLALVHGHRMKRVLARMLDPDEFLSAHGVRSLSRWHRDHPYVLDIDGSCHEVRYEPAESRTGMFGGNSNWRGPVWFPINHLIVEALEKLHHYYGDDFRVEAPTGSGDLRTLGEVAADLSRRLSSLFLVGPDGRRPSMPPVAGVDPRDPRWRDELLFHEYFDGDTGAGLGANHQTGWTALVAKLLDGQARRR